MNLIDIIILAVALGIDCLVVSFSQGLIFKSNRLKNSLALALSMGFFQGFLPVFGYLGVGVIEKYIEPFSKFIVFAIFLTLGVKFIYESFQEKEDKVCCIDFKCLVGLGIATSIDAMASGVSLNLANAPFLFSVLLIGLMSFIMSICGFWSGIFFKHLPSRFLEIFGGLVLIFLAIKGLL